MAAISFLASKFNHLFFFLSILLLHLGCFIFTPKPNNSSSNNVNLLPRRKRKRKLFPSKYSSSLNLKPPNALSSSWSFLKRFFSPSKKRTSRTTIQKRPLTASSTTTTATTSFPSPASSHSDPHPRKKRAAEFDSLSENPFLLLRNDIFPCPVCGEIFHDPKLLEHHESVKHSVSELHEGDSGKNIIRIIFKTGWTDKSNSPIIHRILKIHNSQKILSRFEDYREMVKARAAKNCTVYERCIADGNELLRFHCTTFICNLGQNGNGSLCNQHYCSACGIIRVGFSPKLDGISTLSTSWRAHVTIPDDGESEFSFMNVKRAMIVCRVIAGRVGCDPMVEVDKEDPDFDSLVGQTASGQGKLGDDELLVFNPRAVLPCFLIVYSV